MYCKSASFYIKQKNLDYIDDQIKDKDRYNKSNWLDDLIDHLRSKAKPVIAKEKKKATVKDEIDFSVLQMSEFELSEVKRIRRKNKGGSLTQRVVNGLAEQFNQAAALGYSVDELLTEWESRGWKSLKAEWFEPKDNAGNHEITIHNAMKKIMAGEITSIARVPKPVQKELESLVRFGTIKKPASLDALAKIGFAL